MGPLPRCREALSHWYRPLFLRIPYAKEQGIFAAEEGICCLEQVSRPMWCSRAPLRRCKVKHEPGYIPIEDALGLLKSRGVPGPVQALVQVLADGVFRARCFCDGQRGDIPPHWCLISSGGRRMERSLRATRPTLISGQRVEPRKLKLIDARSIAVGHHPREGRFQRRTQSRRLQGNSSRPAEPQRRQHPGTHSTKRFAPR